MQGGLEGHYRFHDLVRLFARERLTQEEPAATSAESQTRMMRWLLRTAEAAGRWFEADHAQPPAAHGRVTPANQGQAAEWLDVELLNWTASVGWAAEQGRHLDVVELAEAMHWFSDRRSHRACWLELFELAAAAAHALADRRLEAVQLNYLAAR